MSHNDITGDKIASKPAGDAFREGWDRLFGKPAPQECDCEPGKCDKPAEDCRDWNKRGGGG